MAKLNWDKNNRQTKALNDVCEALEDGAFEDVFVIIDETVPPKRPAKSPKSLSKQRKAQAKRIIVRRSRQTAPAAARDDLAELLRRAAKNTKITDLKSLGPAEIAVAVKQIEPSKRFKPIKVPTQSNCASCHLRLRAGKNHYLVPSLQLLICSNCVAHLAKLLAATDKPQGTKPSQAKPSRPMQSIHAANLVEPTIQPEVAQLPFAQDFKSLIESQQSRIESKPGVAVTRQGDRVQVIVTTDDIQRTIFTATANEYGIMKALELAYSYNIQPQASPKPATKKTVPKKTARRPPKRKKQSTKSKKRGAAKSKAWRPKIETVK